MADIAFVFHWPPESMNKMEVEELVKWGELAAERAKLLFKF